jgi:hypothetical protein
VQNESQSHSSLFSIVVYYRADAKADKSGTASPTSDTLTSAKSSKMGKGGTASPTTDTLSSAKAGKGESDGDAKAGKEASEKEPSTKSSKPKAEVVKEKEASENGAKSEKV